jgi:hypothetical protein
LLVDPLDHDLGLGFGVVIVMPSGTAKSTSWL